jgi:hypothetical protein
VGMARACMGVDARAYTKKRPEGSGLFSCNRSLAAEGAGIALGHDFLGVLG